MGDECGRTEPPGAGADRAPPARARDAGELIEHLRRHGARDARLLATLARVPRDRFVPSEFRADAWTNTALPIEAGQTISQPLVVATMTAALAPVPGERVLEIGTGSGYQTAILCELVGRDGHVVSIERHARLAAAAAARLAELGYRNAEIHVGDGSTGWPESAPYDRIMVTAAGPNVPTSLLKQLAADGGRLVMPIGRYEDAQELLLIERDGLELRQRSLGPVRFVPLIGQAGWAAVRQDPSHAGRSGIGEGESRSDEA